MNPKKSQDLPHFHCIFKSRKRNFWSLRFSFEVVFWRKGGKKKIELKLYKSFSPCNLTLLLTWLDPLFKPNLCQGNNSLRVVLTQTAVDQKGLVPCQTLLHLLYYFLVPSRDAMSANAKTRAVFVACRVSQKKSCGAAFLFGVYPRGLLSKVTTHCFKMLSFE